MNQGRRMLERRNGCDILSPEAEIWFCPTESCLGIEALDTSTVRDAQGGGDRHTHAPRNERSPHRRCSGKAGSGHLYYRYGPGESRVADRRCVEAGYPDRLHRAICERAWKDAALLTEPRRHRS